MSERVRIEEEIMEGIGMVEVLEEMRKGRTTILRGEGEYKCRG